MSELTRRRDAEQHWGEGDRVMGRFGVGEITSVDGSIAHVAWDRGNCISSNEDTRSLTRAALVRCEACGEEMAPTETKVWRTLGNGATVPFHPLCAARYDGTPDGAA